MSTAVRERPIVLSGEEVRAVLEGRQTQIRRAVKPQPPELDSDFEWVISVDDDGRWRFACEKEHPPGVDHPGGIEVHLWRSLECPLGRPSDRLWCKEDFVITSFGAGVAQIRYLADCARGNNAGASDRGLPNRIGRVAAGRMPRHCSRLTLEITDVRVELDEQWVWVIEFRLGRHIERTLREGGSDEQ